MKGLRLPLPRRPDPVLTREELRVIDKLLNDHLWWAAHEKEKGPVSESVLRAEIHAGDARAKVRQVLDA